MNTIEWTDALALDFEPIDALHHAFVDLLAQAQQAPDGTLAQAWTALVHHTMAQFAWEDAWMRRTGFASAPNHILQHRVVLNLLREGLAQARAGQLAGVREMAFELAAWFAKHTLVLDAPLAVHMRRNPSAVALSGSASPQRKRTGARAPH